MAVAILKSLVFGTEAAVADLSNRAPATPAVAQNTPPPANDSSFSMGNKGQGLAGLMSGHGRRVAPQASIQSPAVLRKA